MSLNKNNMGVSALCCFLVGCILLFYACDFNVELADEKRVLKQVEGTTPCERQHRIAQKAQGQQIYRLMLVDNKAEAISPEGLDKAPFHLKVKDFTISTKRPPEVLNASDGTKAPGVKIALSVDHATPLKLFPNPHYSRIGQSIANLRIPLSMALLLDMSEQAAQEDPNANRATGPASWIIEMMNSDPQEGDQDGFGLRVMRNDRYSRADNLTSPFPTEDQIITDKGQKKGIVRVSDDGSNGELGTRLRISKILTGSMAPFITGHAPLFESIQAAALDMRATSIQGGERNHHPAVVVVSMSQDAGYAANQPDKSKAAFQKARSALKGRTQDESVPLMAITPAQPQNTAFDKWQEHLDHLCTLAKDVGERTENGIASWGQVLQLDANPQRLQRSIIQQMNTAYHGMKGYIQLKLNYRLQGHKPGQHYQVAFYIDGTLLGAKSDQETPTRLTFQIKTQ